MRVNALATQPHFIDHIAPVWRALPDDVRGEFAILHSLRRHAQKRGLATVPVSSAFRHSRAPVIVAGFGDYRGTHSRDVIYMEHGAGQSYGNGHRSHIGSSERDRVSLFLMPSQRTVEANADWRHVPHAVIGCPKLDPWMGRTKPRSEPPTVAISFHFTASVAPETVSAFHHYRPMLPALVSQGWKVIGHGHPRAFRTEGMARGYTKVGIEPVEDFEDVLRRADLYAVDNSSTLFEFAAIGRPVVPLNAPWFRRDTQLGLRFWEFADVGLQCDRPADLIATIEKALQDPPGVRRRREAISAQVYGFRDGRSAQRGAQAVLEHVGAVAVAA